MLFGAGQDDVAHFAANRPLAAPPGARFNYSSGTSNIISSVAARNVGIGDKYAQFLRERLFGRIGMHSATPEFDHAGTWVASSYVRASARDFARFGLLYLRDGVWDGARLLPEGWVDRR
jgi:CubicO group peptidase (beta-lactamase class C family)